MCFLDSEWRCPSVLQLAVEGTDRIMRTLRAGRETTTMAVLISAVHHRSATILATENCEAAWELTAGCVLKRIIARHSVNDKAHKADDDRDQTEREYAT
jgi:hypothetical protein